MEVVFFGNNTAYRRLLNVVVLCRLGDGGRLCKCRHLLLYLNALVDNRVPTV